MNEFKEILNNWSITYSKICPLKRGLVSEKWLVRTDDSNLILRDTGTNPKYTEAQITLLDHLSQSNFPYHTPPTKIHKKKYEMYNV